MHNCIVRSDNMTVASDFFSRSAAFLTEFIFRGNDSLWLAMHKAHIYSIMFFQARCNYDSYFISIFLNHFFKFIMLKQKSILLYFLRNSLETIFECYCNIFFVDNQTSNSFFCINHTSFFSFYVMSFQTSLFENLPFQK